MVEFENGYLRTWIDRSIKLMYSEWLRPVDTDEYRAGNNLFLQLLNEHQVQYWIADSSMLGDISDGDEDWTLKDLVPAITRTKLKMLVRVSGNDNVSYSKFETFANRAEKEVNIGPIQVRQFVTYKEAADWMGGISA